MPTVLLPDRALLRVSGPEAEHFLQNIITADLGDLAEGAVKPSALLTPQGKILFDFLVSRAGADAFLIDVRADVTDDLVRRLMLYRLRSKVEIAKQDQVIVAATWYPDSDPSQTESTTAGGLADLRFAEGSTRRHYGVAVTHDATLDEWTAWRIVNGVAESGADYALSDAFPHDVLLDQNGGVGFRKGCYVGQEVVSRMQHRGTARRRVLVVSADAELPEAGTEITANGRAIGSLGSRAGSHGLAIVRIDRVKDARDAGQPLLAGDVAVHLDLPPRAGFGFPDDSAADGA